jgi:hypothetical protein
MKTVIDEWVEFGLRAGGFYEEGDSVLGVLASLTKTSKKAYYLWDLMLHRCSIL